MTERMMSQMRKAIYYVGGSKGGIGKSLISTVLVQFLLDKYGGNRTVHLIETDESNPDVGRIYSGKIPVTPLVLDERDTGWITFFDILEHGGDGAIFVVNSAARSSHGIEANGRNFSAALAEQSGQYSLVTFWPVNRQLDCVNLLLDFLRFFQYGPVFVVRNNYWGAAKDFLIYDSVMRNPKNKEAAESRIAGVLDFPSLNDMITLQLYSYGKTIPEVADMLNVYKRQIFSSWKNKAYEMFESTGLFDGGEAKETKESRVK
jgi:hypothetical protein